MSIGIEFALNEQTDELIITTSSTRIKQQRNKGNSLLALPSAYTIVDIETTGLSPYWDEIIELSALKCVDDKIIDTFSSLVNPGYEIDEYITELTGITNQMLDGAPAVEDILPDFVKFLADDIIIGHNVNFDINFIYDNYLNITEKEFKNDFVDLMRMSRILFPDFKNHKLSTLVKMLKVEHAPSHRAADDCYATLDCYLKCKEYAETRNIDIASCNKPKRFDLRSVTTKKIEFDTAHPLYDKMCVFTGKLEKMLRNDAAQIVADFGGHCENNVTKKNNYLILGNFDYCKNIKDGKSTKQKKAESLILQGQDLQIIPEDVFYDMIVDNTNIS